MVVRQEPELPVTPTNEGRRPRISNFGYDVPYPDLWPLMIGVGGSMLLGMIFASQIVSVHWSLAVGVTLLPSIAAHLYIKMWVENALPHTQQDMLARFAAMTPDFNSPAAKWFPLVPRFRPSLSMAADPHADDGLHPLMRLRSEYSRANKRKK